MVVGARQQRRAVDRGAGTAAKVLVHFFTKDNQCTTDEPCDAIWMTTGAPAVNEIAQFENGREATTEARRIEGETLEVCGEVGETMNAGPALTGSLSLHVTDHPSGLSKWAKHAGKECNHSGAEGRVEPAGRLFGEAAVKEIGNGNPAPPISP
jgi:hypothetical protein